MSTSVRFTKILTAVAMTASLAACNDLASSGKQKPVVTTTETPIPQWTAGARCDRPVRFR